MKTKNFKLAQAIYESGRPQFQIASLAGISSEARLSRIVGMRVVPTFDEIERISRTLQKSPEDLGFYEVIIFKGVVHERK